MFKADGIWQCSECDYNSKKQSNMYDHIEARHVESTGYSCDECGKFCNNRVALRNQTRTYHK